PPHVCAALGLGGSSHPTPPLPSAEALAAHREELVVLEREQRRCLERSRALEQLDAPPAEDERHAHLGPLWVELGETILQVQERRRRAAAFAVLEPPPELDEVQPVVELLEVWVPQAREHIRLHRTAVVLGELDEPPERAHVEAFEVLLVATQAAEAEAAMLRHQAQPLEGLEVPPESDEAREVLEVMLADWVTCEAEVAKAHRRRALFDGLEPEPELPEVAQLVALLEELKGSMAVLDEATAMDHAATREVADHAVQMAAWADDHPSCPTCGAPVVIDRWIEGGEHGSA
ncbi:MAG: hypothetical protein AAFX99_35710, partial [Myxococcota bacterium]